MSISSPGPVRVLHIIDSLSPGGAERVLIEVVNNFDKQLVVPSVCVTRSDLSLAKFLTPHIRVHVLRRRQKFERKKILQVGKIIRQNKINLLHAHGYNSFHFAAVAKAICLLRTPLIIHAHSSEPPGSTTRFLARFYGNYFIGVSSELITWGRQLLGFPC